MKTNLGFVVRNKKVHLVLASLVFVLAIFHTFRGQGISVSYPSGVNVSSHPIYMSTSDKISFNEVVTDIQIRKCLRGFTCSGPRANSPAYWSKIPTKLNLFPRSFSLFNYYMYVEKVSANDAERFVVDTSFTLTDAKPDTKVEGTKWLKHKIGSSSFLWINYMDTIAFEVPVVRDANVFYGKQDMKDSRSYWKFDPASIPLPGSYTIQAKLSTLRVAVTDEIEILKEQEFETFMKKNEMIATPESKFKIMQISDLHIGQDTGACYEKCKYDINTLNFVESAIQSEKDVQLIVLTGDVIDFKRTVHYESVILKALSPILESGIPFVFVFGDTDYDASDYDTKRRVLSFISSLPRCYNKKWSDLDHKMHGLSNGNIKVYSVLPKGEDKAALDLNDVALESPNAIVTYLDSEDQRVESSQANYIYRVNHKFNADLKQKLLFLHYPLPNFRPQGKIKLIGTYNEKHPLVTATDKKFLQDVKASGYKAVAVGHEHENDACIWDESEGQQILLCYSGVTGESANTRLNQDYKRRLRVFEFDFENDRILSWKRNQDDAIDPQEIWSEPKSAS